MGHDAVRAFSLLDGATAATLAQVMPVLLLTLILEVRRNQLHRQHSRLRLRTFFVAFGLTEIVMLLSIDGHIYPFQWFDIATSLIVYWLLALIFRLSLSEPDGALEG